MHHFSHWPASWEHTRDFSHPPCDGAGASPTFASLGSERFFLDSVRISPVALATTSRAPPITLPLFDLDAATVRQRDPADVVFKRDTMAMRTRAQQCDASLPFDWRNDPPQKKSAPVHEQLHDALALIIILSRLVAPLLQLRHLLRIELLVPHHLPPVVRQPRLDRFPYDQKVSVSIQSRTPLGVAVLSFQRVEVHHQSCGFFLHPPFKSTLDVSIDLRSSGFAFSYLLPPQLCVSLEKLIPYIGERLIQDQDLQEKIVLSFLRDSLHQPVLVVMSPFCCVFKFSMVPDSS